jgi:hypothetical protein
MLLSLHFSALSSEILDTSIKFISVIDERYDELLFKTMDQGNEVEWSFLSFIFTLIFIYPCEKFPGALSVR